MDNEKGSVAFVRARLADSPADQVSMHNVKGMRFPPDIIMVCIRWHAVYVLSYRNLEEMMEERGVFLDHATINRWSVRFLPMVEKVGAFDEREIKVGCV